MTNWFSKALLVVAVFLVPGALVTADENKRPADAGLTQLDWILGTWARPLENGVVGEHWTRTSEKTWEGFGFQVSGEDTTHTEELRLLYMAGDIYFVSKVAHNPLPVAFKLVSLESNRAEFENESHDFPQRIIYSLEGDLLTGRIEGTKNGQARAVDFPFERVQ